MHASSLHADIEFSNSDGSETATKTWTITNLNQTNPNVSTNNGNAIGGFTAASVLGSDEEFTIVASGYWGWNTADAQNAVSNNTLLTYLSSLDVAGIGSLNGGYLGVDAENVPGSTDTSENRFNNTNEAMVFEINASGLASTSELILESIDFQFMTASDRADFIVYDASENAIIRADWNTNYDGPDSINGPFILEDGDLVIVATGFENDNIFRIDNLNFDIDSDLAPGQHAFLPGYSNISRTPGELIARFQTDPNDSAVRTVAMDFHRGYLMMEVRGANNVSSTNTSAASNSAQRLVFDISDVTSANPSEPDPEQRTLTEVHRFPNERQGHMHQGTMLVPDFRVNHPGSLYYDLSDMLNIQQNNPEGFTPSGGGSRSGFALPYHYNSIVNGTTEIWDTRTSTKVATLSEHGFGGMAIPIGNLLILAGPRGGEHAVASYDISDPARPVLLDVIRASDQGEGGWPFPDNSGYEPAVYRHYITLANSTVSGPSGDRRSRAVEFVDFSDPSNLSVYRYDGDGTLQGATRYLQFQDDLMFVGKNVLDISDIDNNNVMNLLTLEHPGEFMLPLGNIFVSGENTEQGNGIAAIYAHRELPDANPPTVGYHLPADGAINQHTKTRIALLIHETLDYTSITESTLRVFPVDGDGNPTGADLDGTRVASDKDVITFTPSNELAEDTTYKVMLTDGGITDISGNAMDEFSFTFTTGNSASLAAPSITGISSSEYPVEVNGTTALTATAVAAPGTDPSQLRYLWDLGDGTSTNWRSLNTYTHTYTQTGHYNLSVQVRNLEDPTRIVSSGMTITVIDEPTAPFPTNSTQIFCDDSNRKVWCVNPDNDTVTAIDADSLEKLFEVDVAADPRSIAQDASGSLWVTCHDDSVIHILAPSDGSLIEEIQLAYGSLPHDIVFNPSGSIAFVTLYGSGELLQFNASTRTPINTLDVSPNPIGMAVSSDGNTLYVTQFISPNLDRDDLSSGNGGGKVHVFQNASSASISFLETITLAIDTTSEDGGVSARGMPNYLSSVIIDPQGTYAYVGAKKDNVLAGNFREDDTSFLNHDSTVRAMTAVIDIGSSGELLDQRIDFDNSSQPSALCFSPFGDYLFAALQGNNRVAIYDALEGTLLSTTLPTELAPQGMCFDATTKRLFIKNFMQRSVTVHNLTNGLEAGNFNDTAAVNISTVESEKLSTETNNNILLGKQVFYNASDENMGLDGYLACATCHQDGGHDGRTWDFTERGEGLRNTTDLRGRAGTGQGNVHWSANFDEIQDFEIDIRNRFDGEGFIKDGNPVEPALSVTNAGRSEALDALAAYITSLDTDMVPPSPERSSDGGYTADALAGKRLFEGQLIPASGHLLSCVDCHVPENQFSDSTLGDDAAVTLHNVGSLDDGSGMRIGGTLIGIDTPTLMGLFDGAPYLHDGSAATLEAVFDKFDPDAALGQDGSGHNLGPTGYNLTANEKANLLAYLKQIDGRGPGPINSAIWLGSWGANIGNISDDFDGDLLDNYREYLLGGNPLENDGWQQMPAVENVDGSLTYRFKRRTNDTSLSYVVMCSEDLVEWVPADLAAPVMISSDGAFDTLVYTLPTDASHVFYRLEIVED